MKTILTTITLAIAVTVFAFGANSAMAKGGESWQSKLCKKHGYKGAESDPNNPLQERCIGDRGIYAEIEDLQNLDRTDGGRDIADSGNEGSTAAAGANDQ